ncbi:helix-turn-helix transcriptional regulator [Clostridium sporogenes]|uniref:Helix-turn-helix transcriptional regulator n=1 Tax=Clostridium sporogenes TaxID=1509 RepID=A0A7X5SZR6_CLOSG|nr:helix-turn-helix transcriptional regulator [Clostridium sporogenes]AJD29197.1 helix-turn-helix family protein [Clostridium botulinum Prevot_594]NFL97919.1 helix-turn-helix transcriptional regulator [Clostridium botulinum]NFP55444.1 helix-turn-helix transcriptional regulator [Clostridium botulinum]NFQ17646.1 helix-turn-helix transcriptional regulator [Clostridium sporogenes]NFQ20999.1 helix-turn-helix transcriptional regulator [Clostridium sporogenes]
MVNLELFSQRLKNILRTKKMSNGKLATYIGQTTGSISRYISKERTPNEGAIIKMAYFLNVNPNYLKGLSNEIEAPLDIKDQYLTICEEETMSDNELTVFSKRLKMLVNESGKRNKEIAFELNISNGVLSNYINSKREPSFDTLRIICNYFNVSSDYLLGISYSKNKKEENNFKNKMIDILMKGGILDIASEHKDYEELFVNLLKHTCQTFKIVKNKL